MKVPDLESLPPSWRKEALRFVKTGEASQEFLAYLDSSSEAQQVVEAAFSDEEKALEELAAELDSPVAVLGAAESTFASPSSRWQWTRRAVLPAAAILLVVALAGISAQSLLLKDTERRLTAIEQERYGMQLTAQHQSLSHEQQMAELQKELLAAQETLRQTGNTQDVLLALRRIPALERDRTQLTEQLAAKDQELRSSAETVASLEAALAETKGVLNAQRAETDARRVEVAKLQEHVEVLTRTGTWMKLARDRKYWVSATKNWDKEVAVANFYVDEKGNATDPEILKAGATIDEEVLLSVCRSLPSNSKGKTVPTAFTVIATPAKTRASVKEDE